MHKSHLVFYIYQAGGTGQIMDATEGFGQTYMGPRENADLFVGGTTLTARLEVIMHGAVGRTASPGDKILTP